MGSLGKGAWGGGGGGGGRSLKMWKTEYENGQIFYQECLTLSLASKTASLLVNH